MIVNAWDHHNARSAALGADSTSTEPAEPLSDSGPSGIHALDQRQTADPDVCQDTSTVRPDSCAPSKQEHRHLDSADVAGVRPSHDNTDRWALAT